MVELPEVENYRKILLPLISKPSKLTLERVNQKNNGRPLRPFLTDKEIEAVSGNVLLVDIKRKGKILCLVLKSAIPDKDIMPGKGENAFLFIHFGATGRIATCDNIPSLDPSCQEESTTEYPPKHTFMYFRTEHGEATFSDHLKLGGMELKYNLEKGFGHMAPDAWTTPIDEYYKLSQHLQGKTRYAKELLVDDNRIVSGIGHWIADEVLYQTHIHPSKKVLTQNEANDILKTIRSIIQTALTCLENGQEYPRDGWLYHYRWGNQKIARNDSFGRPVTFHWTGGLNSAIVASIQQIISPPPNNSATTTTTTTTKPVVDDDNDKKKTKGAGEKGFKRKTTIKKKERPRLRWSPRLNKRASRRL